VSAGEIVNGAIGVVGVFVFAIGGAILVAALAPSSYNGVSLVGFLSFLLLGLGLWIIVLSGKPDSNKTAS
jgi:hypothetical protein